MQCRDPSPEGLKVNGSQFNGFVENCGLGYYTVDRPRRVGINNTTVFCMACRPGYQAQTNQLNVITACNLVPNCDLSRGVQRWFGGCSQCASGFSFVWNSVSRRIEYRCVSQTDANCYLTLNNTSECFQCQPGFTKNSDNLCERIVLPNCQSYSFMANFRSTPLDDAFGINQTSNYQNFSPQGPGCNQCAQGFDQQLLSQEEYVCVLSPYVEQQQFIPNTNYIPNCLNYFFDGDIRCRVCRPGYLPSADFLGCFPLRVPSCIFTNSVGTACQQCAEGFFLNNNTCIVPSIANCSLYDLRGVQKVCVQCLDGFRLLNGLCQRIFVESLCAESSNGLCVRCVDDYVLVTSLNGVPYCLKISEHLNCLQARETPNVLTN